MTYEGASDTVQQDLGLGSATGCCVGHLGRRLLGDACEVQDSAAVWVTLQREQASVGAQTCTVNQGSCGRQPELPGVNSLLVHH